MNTIRAAFLTLEKILGHMEKEFGVDLKKVKTETYGQAISNVQILIQNRKSFREEIIQELAEPTENTEIREEILNWGPHGAWLNQSLDKIYKEGAS